MNTITITDLPLQTRIGVTEQERKTEQTVLVTVTFEADVSSVAATDDVTKGIDYAAVAESIRTLAATERKTVERLVEDIALALREFCLGKIRVTVKKFPFPNTASVSVTIER